MNARENERGQAIVLSVLALVALLGMSALVLDVGNWFRTKRRLQATADAAALAGAHQLPNNPSAAQTMAMDYANKNGGDVAAANITITSTFTTNDTITVKAAKVENGVFSKVLGIDTANIDSSAKARVDAPLQAKYVAPMVVYCDHPLIKNCTGTGNPHFQANTELPFDKDSTGAPGAFGMLNLGKDNGGSGTPGTSEEAEWILHGFDKFLPLGEYNSDPGAKFTSGGQVQRALEDRLNTVLLFPVYKSLDGSGQNARYEIIGWIGFYLTGFDIHGNEATLKGYFTEYIAQGILSSTGPGPGSAQGFGVKSIQLIG
jgi:Flp pilus assembly protein TadG